MLEPEIQIVKRYLLSLQDRISKELTDRDLTISLHEDNWNRSEGGGGKTRAFTGSLFEKAGVNFSHVWGDKLPSAATVQRPFLANSKFQAIGLSIIIHPVNPFIPTCHANLRFFISENEQKKTSWWFGGGFDLTPYYGFEEDCIHWHETAKKACDPFGKNLYYRYKEQADQYFFIKHRNEPRGIGGIFFDDINENGFDNSFALIRSVGDHFVNAYFPIVDRRKDHPYSQKERDFQLYRRGRYVEFNLVYDRGTLFGLQSDGRIESILISLPPLVSWKYNWQPELNTAERKLYEDFLVPQDWISKRETLL